MNLQLAEKLKVLIATSKLLNDSEREEWDALLELMNDKQMVELNRILSSSPDLPNFEVSKPVVSEAEKLPMPATAIKETPLPKKPTALSNPSLGHILNMPQFRVSASSPQAKNAEAQGKTEPQKASAPLAQNNLLQKSSKLSFLQKLKAMLKEPELPAGKSEELLPAANAKKEDIIVVEPLKLKKPLAPTPAAIPPVPTPVKRTPLVDAQKPPANAEILPKPAVSKTGIQKWPENLQAKDTSAKGPGKIIETPAEQPVKESEVVPQPVSIAASEIKIGQSSVYAKYQPPQAGELRAPKSDISVLPVNAAPIALKDPKDLENFGISNLSQQTVRSLKDLAKRYGYFEVIFHLEKSPMYKSYLNTGSEFLKAGNGDEKTLAGKDGVLSHEEFERVTDLLRIIQSE